MHGFSSNSIIKPLWGKLIKNEQPAESPILEVMPRSTIFYGTTVFSDPYNYQLALKSYVKENPSINQKINTINETYGFQVKDKLLGIMGEVVSKSQVGFKNGQPSFKFPADSSSLS